MESTHLDPSQEPAPFVLQKPPKRDRNFLALDLKNQATLSTENQPVLVVQSPKTPTLSRKLKAVSLDSEPTQQSSGNSLEVSRDVFSMPNTPKRQIKQKLSCDFDERGQSVNPGATLTAPNTNLKKFASNNSISGSQTLKTLPEIMTLQDFSDCQKSEPVKLRTKGLLERRGSNASLTIDLGSNSSIAEVKPMPLNRLNTAKSVSNLYLSSERRRSQETCNNCTIYESVPSKVGLNCKVKCQNLKRCNCCLKSRRKSLSNENLYVPPCGCEIGCQNKDCSDPTHWKGHRKAFFPRQPEMDTSQLSDDFKMHLQNVQYLQNAGKLMTMEELRQSCEISRVPKLHQEFWEVPLNLQEKCYVSGSQSKNRYRGVLPNEHSRVHIPGVQGYIHANYIKGPDYNETAYIATQGPLSHTCTDFWEMVWHSQTKCIVMLTGLVEKGRSKCELYFPLGKSSETPEKTFFYVKTPKVRDKFTFDTVRNVEEYDIETYEFEELNEVTFGRYIIKYVSQRALGECEVRQLEVRRTDVDTEPRVVQHYWLANWPDHKMAHPEHVLQMALDVLKVIENERVDNKVNISFKIDSKTQSTLNKNDLTQPTVTEPTKNQYSCYQSTNVSSYSTEKSQTNLCSYQQAKNESAPCLISINQPNSCSMYDQSTKSDTCQTSQNQSKHCFVSKTQSNPCSIDSVLSLSHTKQISHSSLEVLTTSSSQTNLIDRIPCISQAKQCFMGNQNTFVSCSQTNQDSVVCQPILTDRRSCPTQINLDCHSCHFSKSKERQKELVACANQMNLDTLFQIKPTSHERKKSMENLKLPVVVHCSAGIGRTGCFLAILNGIQQLNASKNVDVLAILCYLRLNRGGMVQTAEQYEFIHRVLSLYAENI